MAMLQLESGTRLEALEDIARELLPLGVKLARWPVGEAPTVRELLARPALEDSEKEQVLVGLDSYFERLRDEAGYRSRDLIVLHPQTPGLDGVLAKFDRCHLHDDDEVRYI